MTINPSGLASPFCLDGHYLFDPALLDYYCWRRMSDFSHRVERRRLSTSSSQVGDHLCKKKVFIRKKKKVSLYIGVAL